MVEPINPPFYPFSDLFKPTLSEVWIAHYVYSSFFTETFVSFIFTVATFVSVYISCYPLMHATIVE